MAATTTDGKVLYTAKTEEKYESSSEDLLTPHIIEVFPTPIPVEIRDKEESDSDGIPQVKEIFALQPAPESSDEESDISTTTDGESDSDTSDKDPDDTSGEDTPESEFLFEGLDPDDELYIAHLKKPDETKTALCILCYEWFDDSWELDTHLKAAHRDNMVLYGCKRCGKRFWARFLRQRHEKMHRYDLKAPIQRYFPKNRPFDHYESRHYLKRLRPAPFTKDYIAHMKSITAQIKSLEYECLVCEKKFQSEEEMREHYDKHHTVQTCDYCEDVFDNAIELQKHLQDDHEIFHHTENYPGGAWKLWDSQRLTDELKKQDDEIAPSDLCPIKQDSDEAVAISSTTEM